MIGRDNWRRNPNHGMVKLTEIYRKSWIFLCSFVSSNRKKWCFSYTEGTQGENWRKALGVWEWIWREMFLLWKIGVYGFWFESEMAGTSHELWFEILFNETFFVILNSKNRNIRVGFNWYEWPDSSPSLYRPTFSILTSQITHHLIYF